MTLEAFIVKQALLPAHDREAMLALHSRYYSNVRREQFLADLAEKDWVIALRNDGHLAGFSTQMVIHLNCSGRYCHFLFSGDTIVEPTCWREQSLAGSFGHLMMRLMQELGEAATYWFLISKGYRTYRFLPVFFRRFIPGPGQADRPELEVLLRAVATAKYGALFDPGCGLIRPGNRGNWLRPEMGGVPEGRRNDPYVDFFLQRNPDYHRGTELACLAEIRRDNLNRHALRVIERTCPTWIE